MKNYIRLISVLFSYVLVNLSIASDRIIIRYKPTTSQQNLYKSGKLTMKQLNLQRMQPFSTDKVNSISHQIGVPVKEINQVANGAHVLKLADNEPENKIVEIIAKLNSNPDVDYAEVDRVVTHTTSLNYNPVQWDMKSLSKNDSSPQLSGDDFIGAWSYWHNLYPDVSPGNGVVVAVIDTGYTPHMNFVNNLVPYSGDCLSKNGIGQCYGYQFISDCRTAGTCASNSSDRDAAISPQPDGLDLGDFITADENSVGAFAGCGEDISSWHGTHVIGTIIANGASTSSGMLGGAYGAKVLPLRALGKCGGYTSDITNAILYAVNQYPGLTNPNKANIINMSFGGAYKCSSASTLQSAINTATAQGAVVVAAAGNNSENVSDFSPASCNNVISVAAKGPNNKLSWYSNYGDTSITASGGNGGSSFNGTSGEVYSTLWASENGFDPNSGGTYVYYEGTSMAAPHVSAALANIISLLNTKNEAYTSSKLLSVLQNSSSFNYYGGSSDNGYGEVPTGLLDAGNALIYADTLYNKMLTSNVSTSHVYTDAPANVVFTNNQSQPITVNSAALKQISSVVINSNTCQDVVLDPGQSCVVSLSQNPANDGIANSVDLGSLQVMSNDSIVIASVAVVPSMYASPTVTNSGGGGGGGCAVATGTNDFSLIIMLFGLSLLYIRNYMSSGRKRSKV